MGNTKKNELLNIFLLALIFRIIVFLLSFIIIYMLQDNTNNILEHYMKWDAHNYFRIAEGGYAHYTENGDFTTLAFFPLYPWLMRIFNFAFRDLRVSGLVLSSLLYSSACCYLYSLFSIDYNRATAKRAIIYLSVFPHAFFFGTIMNESMLLFTSAATLYYIRKHKWCLAGIFGALAAMSRAAGIVLAFPAAVEWLQEYEIFKKLKNKEIKTVWRLFCTKGAWIFLMLTGTFVYLLCNYVVSGEWFKFLEYQQKYWNHHSVFFTTGVFNIFSRAISSDAAMLAEVWLPSALSVIFVVCAIIYGIRRSRPMYSAYLTAYFIMNMSVDYIISTPRYMTCAIPAFLMLADFSEKRKWTEPLITASMAIGFGIYFTAYFGNKMIL